MCIRDSSDTVTAEPAAAGPSEGERQTSTAPCDVETVADEYGDFIEICILGQGDPTPG